MANAQIDDNGRQAITALLNTNGTTIARVYANPTNHGLKINDASTGTDQGGDYANLDENGRPTLYALSSAGDGTFVALYTDSDGKLLIDSN